MSKESGFKAIVVKCHPNQVCYKNQQVEMNIQ